MENADFCSVLVFFQEFLVNIQWKLNLASNSAIWVVPVWQAQSDIKIQADIHRFDCTDQICFWASLNQKLSLVKLYDSELFGQGKIVFTTKFMD